MIEGKIEKLRRIIYSHDKPRQLGTGLSQEEKKEVYKEVLDELDEGASTCRLLTDLIDKHLRKGYSSHFDEEAEEILVSGSLSEKEIDLISEFVVIDKLVKMGLDVEEVLSDSSICRYDYEAVMNKSDEILRSRINNLDIMEEILNNFRRR